MKVPKHEEKIDELTKGLEALTKEVKEIGAYVKKKP